jgi:hypothetical protein
MPYIAISKVRHSGSFFKVGEELTGLNEEQAKRLLDLGVIEGEDEFVADESPGNTVTFVTPENFAKLTAPEQKDTLKFVEIEAAASKEDRIAQYTEFYNEQVNGNGGEVV